MSRLPCPFAMPIPLQIAAPEVGGFRELTLAETQRGKIVQRIGKGWIALQGPFKVWRRFFLAA